MGHRDEVIILMDHARQNHPPIVSVVVPTYNRSDLLRECLESVVNQTFRDWEAIVVNNYSTDDTVNVVASFGDKRITLVNFRNDGVIAASRNQGIGRARGKYVAFLDSDDTWMPDKLAKCAEAFDLRSADVVCHSEIWASSTRREVVHYGPESRTTYESLLFDGNCLSTSALVVRRNWLDKSGLFSEAPEIVTTEDYDLWLRLSRCGAKFVFINTPLGIYRLHDRNETEKSLERHLRALTCVLGRHFSAFPANKSLRFRLGARRRISRIYFGVARQAFSGKMKLRALGYGLRGLLIFPFQFAVYFKFLTILCHKVRSFMMPQSVPCTGAKNGGSVLP